MRAINTEDKLKSLSYLVEGKRSSVVERLSEKLKALIWTGELPGGFVFPNENDFCKYLGVGRSTLRETYKVLQSAGMITRTKRGTYVNDNDVIVANMPYDMVIGMADYAELLEFRVSLEKDVAFFAAQRATADSIERLKSDLEKMAQNIDDVKKLTLYDTMFHLEIARSSQNLLFSRTLGCLMDAFSKTVSRNFNADVAVRRRAIEYHRQILEAIENNNPEIARRVMAEHLLDVVRVSESI